MDVPTPAVELSDRLEPNQNPEIEPANPPTPPRTPIAKVVPPRPHEPDNNDGGQNEVRAYRTVGQPSGVPRCASSLSQALFALLVLLVRHGGSPVTGVSCIPHPPASAKGPPAREPPQPSRRCPITPSRNPDGSVLRYRRCW